MTTTGKVGLGILAAVVIGGGTVAGLRWSQRDLVTVQTSTAIRQDLSAVVTASGEIKPRNYINLGANAMGPITELLVKEGDRVHKNQVVARIENTQASADVNAQKAAIASAEADSERLRGGGPYQAQDDYHREDANSNKPRWSASRMSCNAPKSTWTGSRSSTMRS